MLRSKAGKVQDLHSTSLLPDLNSEYDFEKAIIKNLQIGGLAFYTPALQHSSSEVWNVLGNVKKEFENFGGLLEKAQKNIQTGLGQLDDVVGTRSRAKNRELRNVESLQAVAVKVELPEVVLEENEEI